MKWISRVIIEDFQSHRFTEIDLVEGFNVIVGPSDQGKTAILRAIRWVLYNEPKGNDFIRVGANRAKVSLIMNDGTIVIRERTSSRNRYVVAAPGEEEQIYEGFGHSVPEEVRQATGVRPVKMDEDHQVHINLGMQLDPPFLLDSNGAIKAKAIGRINGVHILDYAHKSTSSELSSKQIEERRVQAELERMDGQLKQYEDLDLWQENLEQAEQYLESVNELEKRMEWLSEKRNQRAGLNKKLMMAKDYLVRLAALDDAWELWMAVQEAQAKWDRLTQAKNRWQETRAALSASNAVIERTHSLPELAMRLSEAESFHVLGQAVEKANAQKKTMKVENEQILHVLGQTKELIHAEQKLGELNEWHSKEHLLLGMLSKQREYQDVERKIRAVLSKTASLEKAHELMELTVKLTRQLELLEQQKEKHVAQGQQMKKIAALMEQTSSMNTINERMEQLEQIMQSLERLHKIRDHYAHTTEDLLKVKSEQEQIEAKLEKWAEQYYEQLRSLGRCPICLGEIESHTVERIVAEIG